MRELVLRIRINDAREQINGGFCKKLLALIDGGTVSYTHLISAALVLTMLPAGALAAGDKGTPPVYNKATGCYEISTPDQLLYLSGSWKDGAPRDGHYVLTEMCIRDSINAVLLHQVHLGCTVRIARQADLDQTLAQSVLRDNISNSGAETADIQMVFDGNNAVLALLDGLNDCLLYTSVR